MYELNRKLKERLIEKMNVEFPTIELWIAFNLFHICGPFRWICIHDLSKWSVHYKDWIDGYAVTFKDTYSLITGYGDTPKEAYQHCNHLVRTIYRNERQT